MKFVILATLFTTLLFSVGCKSREVSTDLNMWTNYISSIYGYHVSYSLPAKAKIFSGPIKNLYVPKYNKAEQAVFFAGYDYGVSSGDNLSEFKVLMRIVNFSSSVQGQNIDSDKFVKVLIDRHDKKSKNSISYQKRIKNDYKYVELNKRGWFFTEGKTGSSYATIFMDGYYLTVTAMYGKNLRQDDRLYKSRRELFDEIVRGIKILKN